LIRKGSFGVELCRQMVQRGMTLTALSGKELTLLTGFRSPPLKRSFALRPSDGRVCPIAAIAFEAVDGFQWRKADLRGRRPGFGWLTPWRLRLVRQNSST